MPGFFDCMKEPPVPFGEPYPLFNRVSLETISFCNRSCHFCPIAWSDRGKERMSDGLFDKVAGELGDLEFDGVIQLFLLSEPTIDTSLQKKAARLRAECPKCSMYISTNGDVFDRLDTERMLQRVESYYDAGINTINVNVYDAGQEQLLRYRDMTHAIHTALGAKITDHKYRKNRGRNIALTDMRIENLEKGTTDALYIKPKDQAKDVRPLDAYCARTQRHMVSMWDGRVPICCAVDVTDESLPIMGDLNRQSILEVWNSEAFFRYRWHTQRAERVLPGCDHCTHKMAYPHVVRRVTSPDTWHETCTS